MILKYLWSLLRHKWFVFLAGLRVGGIPVWRLVIHDWSKFTPSEFLAYARNFYGPGDKKDYKLGFDYAWLHHQKFNPHHSQYWILRYDEEGTKALDMPDVFIREMVADWMGASRTYTGSWDITEWVQKNFDGYIMTLKTRLKVVMILIELGYMGNIGRNNT